MYVITNEPDMLDIVERYGEEHCGVFTFAKKGKSIDMSGGAVDMLRLPIMPDEDTINAIKSHSQSRKKVIAKAKDALKHPEDGDAALCMAMCNLLFMMDSGRDNIPNLLIFVEDPVDDDRNDIIAEYVKECFDVFGLGKTKTSSLKDILRERNKSKKNTVKAVAGRMREFIADSDRCHLSEKGITRKAQLMLYYEIPLRQVELAASKNGISVSTIKKMEKCLRRTYTGRNLEDVTSDKFGKIMAERDESAVDAYKSLRDILGSMKESIDIPKVKFGYEKDDYGMPDEPKMNEDKFKKFFRDEDNAPILILVYAHTTIVMAGDEVGSDAYNKRMKAICKMFDTGDESNSLEKDFMAAVNNYSKPFKKKKKR